MSLPFFQLDLPCRYQNTGNSWKTNICRIWGQYGTRSWPVQRKFTILSENGSFCGGGRQSIGSCDCSCAWKTCQTRCPISIYVLHIMNFAAIVAGPAKPVTTAATKFFGQIGVGWYIHWLCGKQWCVPDNIIVAGGWYGRCFHVSQWCSSSDMSTSLRPVSAIGTTNLLLHSTNWTAFSATDAIWSFEFQPHRLQGHDKMGPLCQALVQPLWKWWF